MRFTDIDTVHGDQVEVTAVPEEVVLGVAEAFADGWQHAVMEPKQARELARLLTAAAREADGHRGR